MRANGYQALIFQILNPILDKYFYDEEALALAGKLLTFFDNDVLRIFLCLIMSSLNQPCPKIIT